MKVLTVADRKDYPAMLSPLESRRFANLLAHLQREIRSARHDAARLDVLATRLSRLATEIATACELAFALAVRAAA